MLLSRPRRPRGQSTAASAPGGHARSWRDRRGTARSCWLCPRPGPQNARRRGDALACVAVQILSAFEAVVGGRGGLGGAQAADRPRQPLSGCGPSTRGPICRRHPARPPGRCGDRDTSLFGRAPRSPERPANVDELRPHAPWEVGFPLPRGLAESGGGSPQLGRVARASRDWRSGSRGFLSRVSPCGAHCTQNTLVARPGPALCLPSLRTKGGHPEETAAEEDTSRPGCPRAALRERGCLSETRSHRRPRFRGQPGPC